MDRNEKLMLERAPSAASNSTSSPSQPRWQRRASERHQYLNDSLRMRSSPSPMSTTPDLDHDVGSEHERHSTLTSTSLHFPRSASTPQRSSSLASFSAPEHSSLEVKSATQTFDSFPPAVSFHSSYSMSKDSWSTCSNHEEPETMLHTGDSMADMGTPPTLSAIDSMKKKPDLPSLDTSGIQVTRAPSNESLVDPMLQGQMPKPATKPDPNAGKAKARSASEREDFNPHLLSFLEGGPEKLLAEGELSNSVFDWEDTDDEIDERSKVSIFQRRHRKHKAPKHVGNREERTFGGGKMEGLKGVGGDVMGRMDRAESSPRITSEQYAAKSPSLTKMFEDSMEQRGYQMSPTSTMSPPSRFERNSEGSSVTSTSPLITHRSTTPLQPNYASPKATGTSESEDNAISKFVSRFRRAESTSDLRNRTQLTGNAFAQEEARKRGLKPQDEIFGASVGRNTTLCYSDAKAVQTSVGQKIAEKLKISPVISSTQQPLSVSSPTSTRSSSFTASSPHLKYSPSPVSATSSSFPRLSPRGLPHGPEDPDWDDAVKWARKEIKKRAARDKREAKEAKTEAKKEEKRMKKLLAGKEAVKRQSLNGMVPKKPLDEITTDEFEMVGEAAILAQNKSVPAKRPNILGAFFTPMQGSVDEKVKQAYAIDAGLENHASLHMLSETDRTPDEPVDENQVHYDAALRMLTGETPVPDKLVNPFDTPPTTASEESEAAVGLGISSEETVLEKRAAENRLKAQMSIEELRAVRQGEELARAPKPQPSARAPYVPQVPPYKRPLTVIQEFDKESSGSANSNRTAMTKYSPTDPGKASPSVYSCDESQAPEPDHTNQDKQTIRNLRSGEWLARDHDSKSVETIESDAIPEPLDIPKTRTQRSRTISANENESSGASPNVPIMHVSKSSRHLQPTESNSFIPRRNSGFNRMIQETSLLKASKLGSHPALRDGLEDYDTESEYSYYHDHDTPRASMPKTARVDSGVAFDEGEVKVGEHGAYNVGPHESGTTDDISAAKITDSKIPRRKRVATLMAPEDVVSNDATNIDLQALRHEVGLPPAQLPAGSNSPKHPNHHFTWNYEKVMCYGVHNTPTKQPALPTIPENQPVDMSTLPSANFKISPTKGKIVGAKVCTICGIHCCRYANLVLTSKIVQSNDLIDETARMNAEQRMDKLRSHHPNGIELFDTFITCLQCDRKVCPGCSIKCMEEACQAIICIDCSPENGVCPVHNEEE